ncbi:hypothetical protein NQ317_000794 [Molorchus minor]|uniref:Retrotransposon gag domain-containing protein n=1 Tax=Molorchus minor TaxID=1323400 RepID=A0ABQ9J4P5_9CUCU|nr:hypothetical protein NQ317_000794 [Molorchus minor]
MANGGIPKFYEFKDDVDDWEVYSERLEQHFVANNVKAEEIKVAVLLSSISASTFTLIKNLCYPSPPQTKKFQELSQLLNHQFSAAKSVWRERIKFYELSQGTRSISEWYAAVRGMATKCNFGTDLPKILKDKFVTGLSHGKVLDRLCEEEESATLENLYALAMKKEQSTIVEVRFVSRSKFPPRGSHFRRPNGNGSYQSRHSARVTSRQEYQPEERQNTEIDRRFDRRQKLSKGDIILKGYNGTRGYFMIPVTFKGKTRSCRFYVVQGGGANILGRDWMASFKVKIDFINNVNYSEVDQIISKVPSLF